MMDTLLKMHRGYMIVNAVHGYEIWFALEFIESVDGYDEAVQTINSYLDGK